MAQDMSLKRNLKKILEMIGIKEAADEEQEMASRPSRVSNASYEEERFTPAKRNPAANNAARSHAPAVRDQGRGYASGAQGARRKAPSGVSVRRPVDSEMPTGTGTMVYYMHALSECSNVIRDLIRGYSILLNLEEADTAQMQRIVDTLAGATFALGAVIRKVSERTYIIAPKNVNIMTSDRFERRY
ncbi:MAG: cell division protein SepF [Clostridia bacterium]|nr:cell division protein SepF [Clostridiales bacterium]MBQ6716317.1 cell division protein SepF [Clostridia bacterium]